MGPTRCPLMLNRRIGRTDAHRVDRQDYFACVLASLAGSHRSCAGRNQRTCKPGDVSHDTIPAFLVMGSSC